MSDENKKEGLGDTSSKPSPAQEPEIQPKVAEGSFRKSARAPEDKPLTKMQKRLVHNLVNPNINTNAAAHKLAGYKAKDMAEHSEMARKIMKKPHVRKAIDELFEEHYSDADSDYFTLLKKQMKHALEAEYVDPNALKLLEYYSRMRGRDAPKIQENRNLTAKVKWPGGGAPGGSDSNGE